MDADDWLACAHSDAPIACHQTFTEDDDWNQPGMKQCRGAAQYRANVCKSPRNGEVVVGPVDRENIFANPMEFKEHHSRVQIESRS
jgi:hypothetical protein